ncbi:MAG: alpha/beta fold hydrolase [Acidobacteriota bacterium]|nr:alpha/beta fold hydrolase [Acidobacteriota bacterium]
MSAMAGLLHRRAERFAAWRATIRHHLYVPDQLPPLEAKRWSTFSPTPGVLADRVTYQSASGMLVPAIVYRPDPAVTHWRGRLPGIVVVNGHGSDKFGWYAFYSGMLFAKAGAVVVTYDPIGEGERNLHRASRASSHDQNVATPPGVPADDWGQRLAGLMQVDLMQAVSYLIAQPEVDPRRIATVGYSMGSFVSGITGAIDTRIHAVLLSGGGVFDGVEPGYFDASKLPCQGAPMRSLRVLGDRGAILYALNAERGPMLVMNGSGDTVMDMEHHPPAWFDQVRARAIALRGTNKNIFVNILYPGISHRTSWVNRDGVLWLEDQLHFALWSRSQILAAPVTHISTWAKANDVDITRSYMREDREGGLDAVGSGFPGIPRKDLMVLPDAEWSALQDRLTYESWAAKTMAAERAMVAHP